MQTLLQKTLTMGWMLGLAVILACPAFCDEINRQSASVFDGRDYVKYAIQEKVAEPHEVHRTPLFEDLPFLKLKAGDQLIKARRWRDFHKGVKADFEKTESYFLLSGGKYYRLDARERNGKLDLISHNYSLLFDWEVTLANAKLLEQVSGEAITPKSLEDLKVELRKEFPESLREAGEIKIEAPHLEGEGKLRRAIFEGLSFERSDDTISKYRFEVGNETYQVYLKKLIIGPRIVEPEEFGEPEHNDFPNITTANRRFVITPTPEEALKKRAEFVRMQKFQAIVNKFLVRPRVVSKGFG